jgi:hypothetical protein
VATLAHPTVDEFGPRISQAGVRAMLERAIDEAPSEIPPPRGWLRRLFARDRSARALVERYRLWPSIEHACTRVTREYGPLRMVIKARDYWGDHCLTMDFYGSNVPDTDEPFEFASTLGRELWDILGKRGRHRLAVSVYPDYSLMAGCNDVRS